MDRIIPDIEWCREISSQLGLPTRCPFSTVDECPRYYQSLSLLSSAGHTAIPPEKDALLLKKWKRHSLWPTIDEQATSVSGSPGRRKTFSNFCPEVAYDRFGFFASELYPYHDQIDQDNGINIGKREGLPDGHWVFNWAHVEKIHYTDCPIYSPLKAKGPSQSSGKTLLDNILIRFRNNPLIAALIIISIIIVGIGSFTDALLKIQTGIEKLFQSDDVAKNKISKNNQPVHTILQQLVENYGSFDRQVAPLSKRVKLLSKYAQPIVAVVYPVNDGYRIILKVDNNEEVASGNFSDSPLSIHFSIVADPIDVPYVLTALIENNQVIYTVNVNNDYAKTALSSLKNP